MLSKAPVVYAIPKRGLLIGALSVAIVIVGVIVAGVILFSMVGDAVEGNRAALEKLRQIQNPTTTRANLRSGIKRCIKEPECLKLTIQTRVVKKSRGRDKTTVVRVIGVSNNATTRQAPVNRTPSGSATPKFDKKPARKKSGGQSNNSPPNNPQQPSAKPPVNAQAPVPVVVCTLLVGINC